MKDAVASIAEDLLARLGSADVYVQKFDLIREMALLVQFDAASYRAASFLDDRILAPTTKGAWSPLARLIEGARALQNTQPLHFIFHTGHVGSTLISRLLDETGVVLSLREPLPLRLLADAADVLGRTDSLLSQGQFDQLLDAFLRLWSRGYDATAGAIVKATSSASRLAPAILKARGGARAIYLNLRAEPYLAALLAGQNSALDLRGHAAERTRRLEALGATALTPLHQLSIGELAALSWLCETWSRSEILSQFPERVLAVDFDAFLADVADGMARIVGHLRVPCNPHFPSKVASSPALARYAKAPEHAYTPAFRAEVMADSRRRNADEIRKGMSWLDRTAHSNARAADILTRASA